MESMHIGRKENSKFYWSRIVLQKSLTFIHFIKIQNDAKKEKKDKALRKKESHKK